MFFYEIVTRKDETFLAGRRSGPSVEITLRMDRVGLAILAVVVLVATAVYAQWAGWSDLASDILKIASSLVSGFLLGSATGQRAGAAKVSEEVRALD